MSTFLYNVPGRTVCDMQNDTILRLAEIPNIVGVKDATGNLERGAELIRRAPKGFAIYSGDDGTALPLMFMGSHGVISVTANVAPSAMQQMCKAALAGNLDQARAINNRLLGLHRHLFVEANPIPVKWVLEQMGMIAGGIRLPLTPLSSSFHALLNSAMEQAGIKAVLQPA
jgi:4-hydroxy-tetrahydrodipicolinate synthase